MGKQTMLQGLRNIIAEDPHALDHADETVVEANRLFWNLAVKTGLDRAQLLAVLRCGGEDTPEARRRSLRFLRQADDVAVDDDPAMAAAQLDLLLEVWLAVDRDPDRFDLTLLEGRSDPIGNLVAAGRLGAALREVQLATGQDLHASTPLGS